MGNELIPLINQRNKLITEKKALVDSYNKLGSIELKTVIKAFNDGLDLAKKEFTADIASLVEGLTKLNAELTGSLGSVKSFADKLKSDNCMEPSPTPPDDVSMPENKKLIADKIVELTKYADEKYMKSYKGPVFLTSTNATLHYKSIKIVFDLLKTALDKYNKIISKETGEKLVKYQIETIDAVSKDAKEVETKLNAVKDIPVPTP